MQNQMYNKLKEQILKETAAMRKINKELPVSGQRVDISVGGRSINIIYYEAKKENAPLLITFHGGGYLFGGNAMDDAVWEKLRDQLKMNVASVEYRKSPDYQYQAAIDDAYDAAVYLYNHAEEFKFDRDHISVMGGSAGAGLAASLCIYAKQKGGIKIENQILLYPFLDLATDPDSKGEGSLSGPIMYVFNELHCKPEEAKNPLVSPVFATIEELKNLPRAFISMADYDALKHEGYQYAEMLEKAGVPIQVSERKGTTHGYFEFGLGNQSEETMDFLSEDEKAMIENGDFLRAAKITLEEITYFLNEEK